MGTLAQKLNLLKCKNKYRHRWIDKGREKNGIDIYDYYCKFCGARKIKASTYHSDYFVEIDGETISTDLAPDCVPFENEKGKIVNIRKRRHF